MDDETAQRVLDWMVRIDRRLTNLEGTLECVRAGCVVQREVLAAEANARKTPIPGGCGGGDGPR